jgi:hypothetical protein
MSGAGAMIKHFDHATICGKRVEVASPCEDAPRTAERLRLTYALLSLIALLLLLRFSQGVV